MYTLVVDKYRTTFPENSFLAGLFLALLSLVLLVSNGQAQTFDGHFDLADFNSAQTIIVDPNAATTCEVEQIWVTRTEESDILMGFHNGNNGSAIFRFYFDTDNDATSGLQIDNFGGDYYVGGSELIVQVNVKDASLVIYEWNTTTSLMKKSNTLAVTAEIGNFSGRDGKFFEVSNANNSIW